MSISVALDRLRAEAERCGRAPYLLTVSDDGCPHAVSVAAAWEEFRVVAGVGRRSAANASLRPRVSLLWPPAEAGGYSLIVDGDARVEGSGDAARVWITPLRGVLHRPAATPASAPAGCSADCVPILR